MAAVSRPHGIQVTDDIYEQYSPEMKEAWNTFHDWWQNHFDGDNPVSRLDMPPEVSEALRQITEASIPGYDGATGADSCYVNGVNMNLID